MPKDNPDDRDDRNDRIEGADALPELTAAECERLEESLGYWDDPLGSAGRHLDVRVGEAPLRAALAVFGLMTLLLLMRAAGLPGSWAA